MEITSNKKTFFERLKDTVFKSKENAHSTDDTPYKNTQKSNNQAIPVPNIDVERPPFVEEKIPDNADLMFAENYTSAGGRFVYSESQKKLFEQLSELADKMGWKWLFCWEDRVREMLIEHGFTADKVGFFTEFSDVAISFCELLIAEDGDVLLSPEQASRRTLPNFPTTHILIADVSFLTSNYQTALRRYKRVFPEQLPQYIDIKGKQKLKKVNNNLFLAAKGTVDIYLFFTDELFKR